MAVAAALGLALLATAPPAAAHGFGQRYDLPLPLTLYVVAAGAAVALSFAVAALFLDPRAAAYPRLRLTLSPALRSGASAAGVAARFAAAALFLLAVAAGAGGAQNPMRNILPVAVWIVWWVGLAFASALCGDVYRVLNPWDSLYRWAARCSPGLQRARLAFPERLGVWPACALLLGFAWMELVWGGRDVPASLAAAAAVYSAITWSGMFLFGRETWRDRGEMFAVVFGLLARFAPVRIAGDGVLELRPWAAGLSGERPVAPSMVVLVVLLLATVSFDGLLETPLWAQVDWRILNAPEDSVLWTVFDLQEVQALRIARTLGLVLFAGLFLTAFRLCCGSMSAMTGSTAGDGRALARRFVPSLVPIAVAYHVAHYFSFFVLGMHALIPLASDPLGLGWDLLGTAAYRVEVNLVSPRVQWVVAAVAVVLGHVLAVYVAHITALETFGSRRTALRSQLPLLALMVGYTMLSLWILSQPIIELRPGGSSGAAPPAIEGAATVLLGGRPRAATVHAHSAAEFLPLFWGHAVPALHHPPAPVHAVAPVPAQPPEQDAAQREQSQRLQKADGLQAEQRRDQPVPQRHDHQRHRGNAGGGQHGEFHTAQYPVTSHRRYPQVAMKSA